MDLYLLTLDPDQRVAPLIVTEFAKLNAEISPDGRWLAYQSNASGQDEVFVRPFPEVNAGGQWQISAAGGTQPLWGPDGQEMFYVSDAGVMGVTIQTETGFEVGSPTLVVESSRFFSPRGDPYRHFDISPDGQRFLMLKAGGAADADDPFAGLTQIHVVTNWFQELKARVPTGQ